MRPCLLSIGLSLFVSILVGQTPVSSCCQMKIDSETAPAGVLRISIQNVKPPEVTVFQTLAELDFSVLVKSEASATVNRTAYGKSLLMRERGGSRISRNLKTGDVFSQELNIRDLFDLKAGTYTVVVSRSVLVSGASLMLQATTSVKVP
jgi:hypothetical protein